MPLPRSKDVGTLIRFLKQEKPGMKKSQRLAIALEQARKAGASIKRPKNKKGDK